MCEAIEVEVGGCAILKPAQIACGSDATYGRERSARRGLKCCGYGIEVRRVYGEEQLVVLATRRGVAYIVVGRYGT